MADPADPTAPLPLELGPWQARFNAAREVAKQVVALGRANLLRYEQKPPKGDKEVIVPHDFFMTEQKKAQLFYQVPEVFLKSERPDADATAPLFASVLNAKALGPKGVNTQVLMDGLVFDVVCPAGFGACKIGYEPQTQTIPDPKWVPPPPVEAAPNMFARAFDSVRAFVGQEPPIPTAPLVPVVVGHRVFADRIPPGRLLRPPEWMGGNLNDAAWIAFEFWENLSPDGPVTSGSRMQEEETLLTQPARMQTRMEARRRVVECWYKAGPVDKTAHPDQIRMFQIADGEQSPRVHKDSPFQRMNSDGTLGGMRGYPIKLLTIRTVSDSPIPPSDCTINKNLTEELSVTRSQFLVRRDRSLPQGTVNTQKLGDEFKKGLEANKNSGYIPTAGPIEPGDITSIDKGTMSRESYEVLNFLERDLNRSWGLGENQTGVRGKGSPTATEMKIIQVNTDTRLDYERQRILSWFCEEFVPAVAAVVQFVYQPRDYVDVLGEQDAERVVAFTQQDFLRDFAFTVQAGSSLRRDAEGERKRWLDLYNLTANDPYVVRQEVTRNLLKSYGLDPVKSMQQPPPTPTEPPKVSVSVKAQDFALPAPIGEIALKLALGQPVTPEDMQAFQSYAAMPQAGLIQPISDGQAPHPGPMIPNKPLDSHVAGETGELPGQAAVVANSMRVQ